MSAQLKNRWSVNHNYLGGICASEWWSLLRENHFAVDPAYWHRAAFITLTSLANSALRRNERREYDQAIEAADIQPPLFILGHWRSGTTLLHYLLAQDSEQFAFPNTYQVINPQTFLTSEERNTRRFAWLVPKTRPMDNMALSFQTPQEDEFAPCLMTLRSLYLGISFPTREHYYSRYLTFRDVPKAEIDAWKNALRWFLKKLTLKYNRPLLLKSPPHTARIRLLLEMFPEARFVHIHRNPYTVFQSFRHYFDTALWYTYLQRPDVAGIDAGILRRYTLLYDAFFEERHLIPKGRLHEVCFEDLERAPVQEISHLYDRLGLSGFANFKPKLQAYVDSLAGYRKNEFTELAPSLRARIGHQWRRSFEEWGYSTQ